MEWIEKIILQADMIFLAIFAAIAAYQINKDNLRKH